MDLFLWLVIVFILAPMVVGPFVVKFTHSVPARAAITPVSPENLAPDVKAFIDMARVEFEALGFEFIGYISLLDHMPKMSSFFGLFTNEQRKTSGMAAVIKHASGRALQYYELTNKYSNGRVINVNTSPVRGSYKNPDKSSYRYPDVRSIRQLCEINNWLTGHDRRAVNPAGLIKGREMEMVGEALNNEIKLQAKYGYYSLDEKKDRYRLTWKGAVVMTEKNAFPIRNVLGFLDLRSAKKAVEGMHFH